MLTEFFDAKPFDVFYTKKVPYTRDVAIDQVDIDYYGKFPYDIISYYYSSNDRVYERIGCLRGRYLLFANASFLLSPDGDVYPTFPIDGNPSLHDRCAAAVQELKDNGKFDALRDLLADNPPSASGAAIVSHPYCTNYFHFHMEALAPSRFFGDWSVKDVLIPSTFLAQNFQRQLIQTMIQRRQFMIEEGPFVIENPILATNRLSRESILFTRRMMAANLAYGKRRLYIKRGQRCTRAGGGAGGLSPRLEAVLADLDFETISFGSGEIPVHAQIAMLNEAAIIVAPHGAALTNITHINSLCKIVEIMGPHTANLFFYHISKSIGMDHKVVATAILDDEQNLDMDPASFRAYVTMSL